MNRLFSKYYYSAGVTLFEILVSILILLVGIISLAGLQAKLMQSEMEAQQRTQAQMLAQDMVDRILAYGKNASIVNNCLADSTRVLGTGFSGPISCSASQAAAGDLQAWSDLLKGTTEQILTTSGSTSTIANTAAMIGARGCIEPIGSKEFRVSVAWQGLIKTIAPPTGLTCGLNQYDDERKRRIFAIIVQL